MSTLDLAVVGNCSFSALIDREARIVWSCVPRFDGDPVFCALLDQAGEKGVFEIRLDGLARVEQRYLRNTAVLVTTLHDGNGSALEVTDFSPRFKQHGRTYRPVMVLRQIRPVSGIPRIRIRLRPTGEYGAGAPEITHGSNHVRYVLPSGTLRLTTDVPISFLLEEVPFVVEEEFTLLLGPDESLTRPVAEAARTFREETVSYWREWTRGLALPFEWQEEVIRAAITLKLCSFDETGAVIAAMTTSIPEAPDSGRNWDYRYCWLRDAYFVVQALARLGATRTMEGFLRYITNVAASLESGHLQPVYSVTLGARLVERVETSLSGYRGMGPVRVGNQAYEHLQNDVYGSVILAAAPMFFDQRLDQPGNEKIFERLETIGEQAVRVYDKPDAGLWEFRSIAKVHTFSAVMCWVACDRLARVADRLGLDARSRYWRGHADAIHEVVVDNAWNAGLGSFVESFGGVAEVDASLLLLAELGFVEAGDPRFVGTVEAVGDRLRKGDYLFRYRTEDDFGMPRTSFTICTFWYVNALAAIGRRGEARQLFENLLARRNHVGLLSEDMDPDTGELWGNFPQTYSMVGMISCAMRLSRPWEEAF